MIQGRGLDSQVAAAPFISAISLPRITNKLALQSAAKIATPNKQSSLLLLVPTCCFWCACAEVLTSLPKQGLPLLLREG